jgi:hypothetical protein
MQGLSLALGFGRSLPAGSGTANATAPANYDYLWFTDSRGAFGQQSTLDANGFSQNDTYMNMFRWASRLSNYRIRPGLFPNYGLTGNSSTQMIQNPRQNTSSVVTTGYWYRPETFTGQVGASGNKGYVEAAADSAAIVFLLMGTNDNTVAMPVTTQANMTTLLDLLKSKVVIILNEMPRGVNKTGGAQQAVTDGANRKLYSDWLNTLDYASGNGNSRPNVIVVDTWAETVDPATGPNWKNKQGYFYDGVHQGQWGARKLGQKIVDRLSAVWAGQWASLPQRFTIPTTDGLSVPANAQPFVNTNPIFTPGTNGSVSGTFAVPPTAATIAQGWDVNSNSNATGFTVVADKTTLGPDGEPCQKLTISGGALAASTVSSILVRQQICTNNAGWAALLSANRIALTDMVRAVGRYKVNPGSTVLHGVSLQWFVTTSPAAGSLKAFDGQVTASANDLANSSGYDAYDQNTWYYQLTQMTRLDEPNMAANALTSANGTVLTVQWDIRFLHDGVTAPSATIYFSRTGLARVSS